MPAAAADPNQLLERLERGQLDASEIGEARALFIERGDIARARWLDCELEGYGAETTASDLRRALGADASDEVVAAALRARLRRGQVRMGADGPVVVWPHFFVEPLGTLVHFRDSIGAAVPRDLIVDLSATEPGMPPSLGFRGDVFHDIVQSIVLEIADAVRRAS